MRFLSVCSGIEAASVAWNPLGWEAVAFSEIEPFPCAVLAHHYPSVPNWGDMTKFQEWPDADVDLLHAALMPVVAPTRIFMAMPLERAYRVPATDTMSEPRSEQTTVTRLSGWMPMAASRRSMPQPARTSVTVASIPGVRYERGIVSAIMPPRR